MAGTIPIALRQAMGDRVYGCDDCLDACPPGAKRLAGGTTGSGRVDLEELLAADDAMLLASYSHFYVPRRNPRYLRRNALVALGNSAAGAAVQADDRTRSVGILAGYLGHPDELYRVHAAWALGRIGGTETVPLLEHQLEQERSDAVVGEIKMAIEASRAIRSL